ncbi:restriction endonuclease subunit S [Rhodanobacter sp. UC4451_H18]
MLSEVAQIVNGGTPKSNIAEYWAGGVPWLTPKDMGRMDGREIATTPRTVSEEGLANSSARLAPANSVILSTRAPIGHLAINMVPMAFNQGCRGIVPNANLDHIYLYYFLAANRKLLDDLGVGTTFKELSATNLRSVRLPLPPLDDQKRIVAVLDQAFAALDRARAHAEANLADSLQLFESIVTDELDKRERSWSRASLGTIYDVRDGTHDSPKYLDEGRALVTSKNLGRSGLNFDKVKLISEADYLAISKRSAVHQGDVLFAMIGTIGNPVVVEVVPDFAIKNVALFKMRDGRDGRCLRYILNSKTVRSRMQSDAKGTTQKFVGLGYLRAFEIALPSITEEQHLIERLSAFETKCDQIASEYKKELADLAILRQSLLQKAFAGELA